jgi:hypothetical protein
MTGRWEQNPGILCILENGRLILQSRTNIFGLFNKDVKWNF